MVKKISKVLGIIILIALALLILLGLNGCSREVEHVNCTKSLTRRLALLYA